MAVEANPSPMRPVRLVATLDRARFLDQTHGGNATLEFEWRPRSERDEFRIQYTEPGTPWSCGWHQDETHDNLGPSHFQVDHDDWPETYREPTAFTDAHPMAVLDACLGELRDRVPDLPGGVRPSSR